MTTIRRKHHKHRPHSKLAQRKRKLLFFKIGGMFIALLLIAICIAFGLKSERINIANINIKGNSILATKVLTGFTKNIISGKYIYIFPKSSIFLYPKKNLQALLLNSFKEIKKVDVSFENLQSISVNIEERKPYALYCGNQISTTTDCYFLDEDGLIFTKAPEFSGNVFLRYFGAVSGDALIGSQFMKSESFHEINFFLASLPKLGLNPITFSIVNKDDFEIILSSSGKIMFGKKQSLSSIFENIQSVFDSDEFDKNSLDVLDYADFRFGNKVYFKFK